MSAALPGHRWTGGDGVSANPGGLTERAASPQQRRRASGPGRRGAAGALGDRPRTGTVRRARGEAGALRRRVSEPHDHNQSCGVHRARSARRWESPGRPRDRAPARGPLGYLLVVGVCAGSLGWMWESGSHGVGRYVGSVRCDIRRIDCQAAAAGQPGWHDRIQKAPHRRDNAGRLGRWPACRRFCAADAVVTGVRQGRPGSSQRR